MASLAIHCKPQYSLSDHNFLQDYQLSMFGGSVVSHKEPEDSPSLMYSLCLSVSGEELLQANRGTPLVVSCLVKVGVKLDSI